MTNTVLSGCQVKLGQLINISTGKLDANAASESGEYPFFTCAERPLKIDSYEFDEDAVLLAGNGSFGVSQYSGKFNAYQRTYVITPIIGPTRYYYWLVKAKIPEITASNRGSTVKYIRKGDIENVEFPLPPLAEQVRIAQKLDELLAQVDTLKARIDNIHALLKSFRQSVLASAVSGRLTEEWRGGAEVDWSLQRAVDVCEKVQSGGTPKEGFSESGVPFLKVYNIVNQEIDFEYRPQFISETVHRGASSKSITLPGDVVMNIVGPPLGKVATIPTASPEWNINQAITLFRPSKSIVSGWISIVLLGGENLRSIINETKGSAGQVNISLSQCRDFLFPVPSVEEQIEIVRRAERLFAFADQLEAKVISAKSRVDNLTQSILAKAFRGELVPQNPDDEPASVLLERIKTQRAATPKAKRGRKASA